jgi:hypothetical protein
MLKERLQMIHLPHLKHVQQLEMVAGKDLQIEKVQFQLTEQGWIGPAHHDYQWFFYIIDGKFVLNHPHTVQFKQVYEDLPATVALDETSTQDILQKIECQARICSRLDDSNRSNQRLFIKRVDSAIIVKLDFSVKNGVVVDELPEQLMVTSEWLHEGKLFWVTNMPYSIYPRKETFNALKVSEDTPTGNWHVKLYIRDQCFAGISFRMEENVYAMY